MDHPAITIAHFMLGGMDVNVDHIRVQLKLEYKNRMTTVIQHVSVGLAHRMRH